jgi:xanthine dehydrogenase accessory factor
MLVYDDGEIAGTIGGGRWEHMVRAQALDALRTGQPRRVSAHLTRDLGMCCGGAMEVYIEPLATQHVLHLFGAGHVAAALHPIAQALGFRVVVYDDRDELLTAERFPGADRVEGDPLRHLPELGGRDYGLIVTHDHLLDQRLLEALIEQPFAYLGMIGSQPKVVKFLVRLRAAGVDEALFQRVSAPVGLDLGAETPEEIAVSIAAELVRVRRACARPPVALSEKPLTVRGGDGVAQAPGLSSKTR